MQKNVSESGIFNANKIKKYWKNQKPPQDVTSSFTDPYFPPNINSLHALDEDRNFLDPIKGSDKAKELNADKIEWKRVKEIMPKAVLFEDKIEFNDIKQGNLGNCYFLSAIAALTEFPYLIYQIFRTSEANIAGYYEIVLFLDGEWQIVFVDDYIPVGKGTEHFIFAKPNGLELWVLLLEKAWAKVNGGYSLTIAGFPSDPLTVLTGFSTERISHEETNIEELFRTLVTYDKDNYIMCTSTKNDENGKKLGLVEDHAYTLIGAKEHDYNGKKLRLIRIRNPWGCKEWTGDWSDNSPLWNEELKNVFNQVKCDDGTFYMSLEDFVNFFDSTYVCHIMYDCNIKSKILTSNDLKTPQVFNIYLNSDCRTAFSLIFRHWRFNRKLVEKNHPATMVVARYDSDGNIFDVDGVYSSVENLEFVRNLKKGYYVVWVYSCLDASEFVPDRVVFRCYSTDAFKLLHCGADTTFKVAKKLLLEGIKQKDAAKYQEKTILYNCVDNQFKKTGLGYRAIFNKEKDKTHEWQIDATNLKNEYILPPFTDKGKFTLLIPQNSMGIVLGLRTRTYSPCWFNVKAEYHIYSGKCPKQAEAEDFSYKFLQNFLQEDFIISNDNPLTYYDYHSSSLELSKKVLEFSHIDFDEGNIEKIRSEHPKLVKMILDLEPWYSDLNFNKVISNKGFYIGELSKTNDRQGRGTFVMSTTGNFYVGYWDKGKYEKYGRKFEKDDFLSYEGEFSKGCRSGVGTQYYRDGGKYVGSFLNDLRHGKGKMIWGDGSSWEGPLVDGQFHGVGTYSIPGQSPTEAKYENGKYLR
jgi:hypothetical protein